jgi:hypothetical protein
MLIKARDDLHQFVFDLLDCIAHQVRRDRNVGRKLIEVVDAADRVYNSGIQVLTNIFGQDIFTLNCLLLLPSDRHLSRWRIRPLAGQPWLPDFTVFSRGQLLPPTFSFHGSSFSVRPKTF